MRFIYYNCINNAEKKHKATPRVPFQPLKGARIKGPLRETAKGSQCELKRIQSANITAEIKRAIGVIAQEERCQHHK